MASVPAWAQGGGERGIQFTYLHYARAADISRRAAGHDATFVSFVVSATKQSRTPSVPESVQAIDERRSGFSRLHRTCAARIAHRSAGQGCYIRLLRGLSHEGKSCSFVATCQPVVKRLHGHSVKLHRMTVNALQKPSWPSPQKTGARATTSRLHVPSCALDAQCDEKA